MRIFIVLILATSIISCSKVDSIDYDIEISIENDTIYEYQELKLWFSYSSLIEVNKNDSILTARITSPVRSRAINLDLKKDSMSLEQKIGYSPYEFGVKFPVEDIIMEELEFEFSITTKSGVDTTFNHKITYFYNSSVRSPIAEGNLTNNKRNGRWIFYDSQQKEKIKAITHFNEEGFRDGIDTVYYDNGIIENIKEWNNGLVHGIEKSFDEKGRISNVGQNKRGLQHGNWISVSAKGIIAMKRKFENGELVSNKYVYPENEEYNE